MDDQVIDGQVLLERAQALVPALRERARETEALRHIPQATMQDVEAAGLFRAFVPQRFGGYGIDFRYGPQITRTLARGCLSTAWVVSFLTQHNWQLALFPEPVQQQLWADRPWMFAPAHVIPGGKATPTDGGYRLSGKWAWSSGVMHSDWFFAAAVVPGDGPAPDVRYLVVPMSAVAIEDNWEVAGLAGTGSNTIVADDVFVPDPMWVTFADLLGGTAPGLETNDGYLWRVPMVLVLGFNSIIAAAVGTAEAAHEVFVADTQSKQIAYGGGAARTSSATRMRIGQAQLEITTVRTLLDTCVGRIDERTRSGPPLTEFERLELLAQGAHIIHMSRRIVDTICEGAGSSFNFLSHPLQRMRRDLNVLATHGIVNADRHAEIYGRVLLGDEIPPEAVR